MFLTEGNRIILLDEQRIGFNWQEFIMDYVNVFKSLLGQLTTNRLKSGTYYTLKAQSTTVA